MRGEVFLQPAQVEPVLLCSVPFVDGIRAGHHPAAIHQLLDERHRLRPLEGVHQLLAEFFPGFVKPAFGCQDGRSLVDGFVAVGCPGVFLLDVIVDGAGGVLVEVELVKHQREEEVSGEDKEFLADHRFFEDAFSHTAASSRKRVTSSWLIENHSPHTRRCWKSPWISRSL